MTSADRLLLVYERAEAELRQLVRAASLRGARGTEGYYRRQARAVARVVAELRRSALVLAPAAAGESYRAGAELTGEALGEATFSGVDREAVRALSDALAGRLDRAAVTVGRSADDALRRAQLEEVALGTAAGLGRRSTSARLRARLADEGTTALVDAGGKRWRLEAYSAMAVVTTSRQAATQGTVDRLTDLGEDLIAVSEHVGSCPVCVPYEGRTYSLSGRTKGYPRAVVLPPFHPWCRHVAGPATAILERFERELGLIAA